MIKRACSCHAAKQPFTKVMPCLLNPKILFFLILLPATFLVIGYLSTTTYTYVVKANVQYLSFSTADTQMEWNIQAFKLCEETDTSELDLFAEPTTQPTCSTSLSTQDTLRTSKFEIAEGVKITISWVENYGFVANLYHPEQVGTVRFFSDSPSELATPPVAVKGHVRLELPGNLKSHELLLKGVDFELGRLPTASAISSLKDGVLEAYGAREKGQSYRYSISTLALSQGSVVRFKSANAEQKATPYIQGFLRVSGQEAVASHFFVHLGPPYKYNNEIQKVAAEVTEFGADSKNYTPNPFEVIQRDYVLATAITIFAIFLAIAALARALMDLRELFSSRRQQTKE